MTDVFLELLDEGALSAPQNEHEVKTDLIDVSSVVRDLVLQNCETGAIKIDQEDDVAMSDVDEAMKAMEYSILQSLRKVDVMTRVSESQYLIVLTEAHSQNLQMIIDRVFASFFKNSLNTKIKPTYEIK